MEHTIPAPSRPNQHLRKHHLGKQYGRPNPQLPPKQDEPSSRKFWIVPDRPISTSTAASITSVAPSTDSTKALQEPVSSNYNHSAVAVQHAPNTPYLVSPETASERMIASGVASVLAPMPFTEASKRWMETRKSILRPTTFKMLGHNLNQVTKYFGTMRLETIHVGHLRDYQQARIENRASTWTNNAGLSLINHELSVVQQILKAAKLWTPIADVYHQLPLPPSKKKKVLDELEERHLFAVAASRPEWELAFMAAKLTRNTTAAGTELRHLRFEDVLLDAGEPRIVINSATAKNSFRGRVIALNPTAKATIEHCIERANKLGSHLPEHFIFPKRVARGKWDPNKPASTSWLRNSFHGMRTAAGFPWLTPHCFRHMAITVMLEKGAAPETVRRIAGHVSEAMMKHYSHNRHAAQMAVLEAMDSTPKPKPKRSAPARSQQQRFMARGRRRILRRSVAE